MVTPGNRTYLRHDVMYLVDTMTEHYKAGRMKAYNIMRTDLAEWVEAVSHLLDSTKDTIPMVDRLVEELRRVNNV